MGIRFRELGRRLPYEVAATAPTAQYDRALTIALTRSYSSLGQWGTVIRSRLAMRVKFSTR